MHIRKVHEDGIELSKIPENTVFRMVGHDEDGRTYLKIVQSAYVDGRKRDPGTISVLCLNTGEVFDDSDESVLVHIYPNATLEIGDKETVLRSGSPLDQE